MALSIPCIEFASSSSKLPRMYDVLINFTGDDIRIKFVSHLDSVLSNVGFTTFLHHPNAVKPMHIQQQPILDLCRVAIVVFTKTYSQSAWCLHELQQIIKWHETYCRHVLPVYYEISPSDVRLQNGDFGRAFEDTARQTFSRQQLEHGMSRWSHALTKAANFFGWDENNYRSDAELVDKIVKTVLNLSVLSATKFLVGLQPKVEDLIRIIKNKSTEVCTIGICGVGGSGKTTLAKAIYHQIHGTFTEKSFIEVTLEGKRIRSCVSLQEQLLSDVLKVKVKIARDEMGRSMIRERLNGKRVLIVLDDVNQYGPLDLWESSSWFGEGTVIIITTSDEQLLRIHQVDSVFRIDLMSTDESLELLSWHAFREAKPKKHYNYLARTVVNFCGGLPLILEVIGAYLFGKNTKEWETVGKRSHVHVKGILKTSFDGLHNEMEKDLFLDICSFFVGKDKAYVTKILNGCGVDIDGGIRVLIERNLIKLTRNNKFRMHPLLQEMGREIVARGGHARYALGETDVFSFKRTKIIRRCPEKLFLTRKRCIEPYPLRIRHKSRLLKVAGNPGYLRNSSEFLLYDCYLHDAILIDLRHSVLRLDWKKLQVFAWLKVLNLSHSKYLTKTPDFSRLPSLEQLILKDCPRLREVHQSIGCLCNLTLLNLKDCTSLSNLSTKIYMLKSLKTLILSGCSKIYLLEKEIVKMESLMSLIAENTAVIQVPFSIVSSRSIGYISLHRLEGLSRNLFHFIIRSRMSPTMNPLSYIHSFMDMEDNTWDAIAPFFSSLVNLRSVFIQCDAEFQLSKQVKTILVEYGVNITESRISKHCFRSSVVGVGRYNEFLNTVEEVTPEVTRQLREVGWFRGVVLTSSESCDVCLPGDNDPYWLAHIGEGHSVSFTVPQDRVMKGIVLYVVYLSTPGIVTTECFTSVLIVNYTKCTLLMHNHGTVISFNDEDWYDIMSNLGSGDKVEIFVTFGHGLVVKNTAVYLIYCESEDLEREPALNKNSFITFIKKIVM